MGSDPRAGSAVSTNNASNALRIPQLKMANILDDICEPGPLLTPEAIKAPIVSKATVQRCISKLSPHWTDEQLDHVIEVFNKSLHSEHIYFGATLREQWPKQAN